MPQSESIKNLAAALAAFQAKMEPITKNAQGYGYNYADLNTVWDKIRKNMSDNGLSVVQLPVGNGGLIGVETTLMHTSGEWKQNEIIIPIQGSQLKKCSDVQSAGSIITYLRRYGLSAALGLVTEEDIDGATNVPASGNTATGDSRVETVPSDEPNKEDLETALGFKGRIQNAIHGGELAQIALEVAGGNLPKDWKDRLAELINEKQKELEGK